ncbi:hypothetical protein Y1Q_0021496 [Alligator mississippiensis]|uniref:Uncharacterized protein n=1 Tax=Alligator mississippiensis TaxID=8496 RepID=A0A151PA04_ALLMI|nr:hypothetical protein Y1Q_0021496 [Alligator mississippiensis]
MQQAATVLSIVPMKNSSELMMLSSSSLSTLGTLCWAWQTLSRQGTVAEDPGSIGTVLPANKDVREVSKAFDNALQQNG